MSPSTVGMLATCAVTEIVENGDLLLIVGVGAVHARLKVSSKVLTLASAKFEAMIRHKKQGQEEEPIAKSSTKQTLYLVWDHSQAMKLLMLVLHGKYTAEIEQIKSTDVLAEIALLIRKYGLVGKMGYLLEYVRLKQQSLGNFNNCCAWFTALLNAHRHGDSSTFRNMSRLLILNHESGFSELIDRTISGSFELSKEDIQSHYKISSELKTIPYLSEW